MKFLIVFLLAAMTTSVYAHDFKCSKVFRVDSDGDPHSALTMTANEVIDYALGGYVESKTFQFINIKYNESTGIETYDFSATYSDNSIKNLILRFSFTKDCHFSSGKVLRGTRTQPNGKIEDLRGLELESHEGASCG